MIVFYALGHNNINNVTRLPYMPSVETSILFDRVTSASGIQHVVGSGRITLTFEYLTPVEHFALMGVLGTDASKSSVKATVIIPNEHSLYETYNCIVTVSNNNINPQTGYYNDIDVLLTQLERI